VRVVRWWGYIWVWTANHWNLTVSMWIAPLVVYILFHAHLCQQILQELLGSGRCILSELYFSSLFSLCYHKILLMIVKQPFIQSTTDWFCSAALNSASSSSSTLVIALLFDWCWCSFPCRSFWDKLQLKQCNYSNVCTLNLLWQCSYVEPE
jgi:hypothetical protein